MVNFEKETALIYTYIISLEFSQFSLVKRGRDNYTLRVQVYESKDPSKVKDIEDC